MATGEGGLGDSSPTTPPDSLAAGVVCDIEIGKASRGTTTACLVAGVGLELCGAMSSGGADRWPLLSGGKSAASHNRSAELCAGSGATPLAVDEATVAVGGGSDGASGAAAGATDWISATVEAGGGVSPVAVAAITGARKETTEAGAVMASADKASSGRAVPPAAAVSSGGGDGALAGEAATASGGRVGSRQRSGGGGCGGGGTMSASNEPSAGASNRCGTRLDMARLTGLSI